MALGTLAASVAHEINNPLTYVLAHGEDVERELDVLEKLVGRLEGPALHDAKTSLRARAPGIRADPLGHRTHRRHHPRPADLQPPGREQPRARRPARGGPVRAEARRQGGRSARAHGPRPARDAARQRQRRAAGPGGAEPDGERDAGAPRRQRRGTRGRRPHRRRRAPTRSSKSSDSGPGVPVEDRERIFEPFFSTKEIGVGTGLGLFVCRNIVRGLSGDVTVSDRPGGGAVFNDHRARDRRRRRRCRHAPPTPPSRHRRRIRAGATSSSSRTT